MGIVLLKLYVLLNLFLGDSLVSFFGISVAQNSFLTSIHFRTLPFLILCYFFVKNKRFLLSEGLMIILCIMVFFTSLLMNKSAMFAVLVNNAIEPVILICILRNYDIKNFVRKAFILFFLLECFIAWSEVMTKHIYFADLSFMAENRISYMMENEMRAFSLHGHPLQNAFLVSILSFFFIASEGKLLYRYILFTIGFITLFAFNTRSSIYLMSIIGAIYIYRDLRKNRLHKYQKIIIVLFVILTISVLLFMMDKYDFGSRLSQGLSVNDDSSNTRYMLIGIIANLSTNNLLFGMDNGIELITNKYNFFAVENSLANFILTNGLIFTICWCVLIYIILKSINRNTFKYNLSFFVFFTLLNANNSLMTNAPIIVFYILSLYSLDNIKTKQTEKKTFRYIL